MFCTQSPLHEAILESQLPKVHLLLQDEEFFRDNDISVNPFASINCIYSLSVLKN